jgi:SAM-dependent methyltransferase
MNRLLLGLHRRSREKKYRLFLDLMRPTPGMRILNVGATGTRTGLQEQLESWYPEHQQITGGGPELDSAEDYRTSFPQVTALVFDGCAMPFADKSFDIVYSNAVLEHLPGPDYVARFAAEVQRVGRGWFVSTPNLWFPVEPHYHLPLVQFLRQPVQRRIAASFGKPTYDYLQLLSAHDMRELFPTSRVVGCRVTVYPETLIAYRPSTTD